MSLRVLAAATRTHKDTRRFDRHGDAFVPPRCLTKGPKVGGARQAVSKESTIAGVVIAKTVAERRAQVLRGTALGHSSEALF